jgi:photosystem II stability/assembly factor-like uncharacterized protein
MRKLLFLAALFLPLAAVADTYQMQFGWVDPTTYRPDETPVYEAKYRIAGGGEVVISGLSLPGGSVLIEADGGQAVEVTGRQCNLALCSDWMAWVTATTPFAPTQPETGTGMSVTIIRVP